MINSIVNFSLSLLYTIFTKTNGTILPILLVLRGSISEEMFTVDEDIARKSGEYVAITVILDRFEKFYISPWMQYSTILLLSSQIDLTNLARFAFSRSVEACLDEIFEQSTCQCARLN